jgi:6-phosphogluconolactonase (cycloisomerase 2 family)
VTPLAGSPYAASLVQNANVVTNGANLYAIAEGDTNLDVFSIDKSSGALTLANTTSVIAGDPNTGDIAFSPLALDHTGASLYVGVGTNINGGVNVFAVGSGPNAKQVQYLSGPSLALSPQAFSPNNQFGYASACSARVEGFFGFTRASDGTLKTMNPGNSQAPGNFQGPTGNPGEAFCPQGFAASAKGYLSVVWFPFAYASTGQVGTESYVTTYTINADGTLTAVANSQVKTASSSANKVVANFDPTGSFLAVAGDGGVQTFAINASGTLSAVGSPQSAGANFQNVAWDNSNHVFAANSSQLYVFNSSTGVLTPASGSPHAGGPELAVLPLK